MDVDQEIYVKNYGTPKNHPLTTTFDQARLPCDSTILSGEMSSQLVVVPYHTIIHFILRTISLMALVKRLSCNDTIGKGSLPYS